MTAPPAFDEPLCRLAARAIEQARNLHFSARILVALDAAFWPQHPPPLRPIRRRLRMELLRQRDVLALTTSALRAWAVGQV